MYEVTKGGRVSNIASSPSAGIIWERLIFLTYRHSFEITEIDSFKYPISNKNKAFYPF